MARSCSIDGQPPQIQDTQQPVYGIEFPGDAAVAQLLGQARGVGQRDGAQQVSGGEQGRRWRRRAAPLDGESGAA